MPRRSEEWPGAPRDAAGAHDLPAGHRAAALVEISERVYRGMFGSAMAFAVCLATYSFVVFQVAPGTAPIGASVVVGGWVVAGAAMTHWRAPWYRAIRRHPALLLMLGVLIGCSAASLGTRNEGLYYGTAALLSVNGLATPLRWVVGAAFAATVGFSVPHLAQQPPELTIAAGPMLANPPVVWLIVDQIVRYSVRAYQPRPTMPVRLGTRGRRWLAALPARARARVLQLRPGQRTAELPVPRTENAAPHAELSGRELQALLLAASGLDHAEAAAALGVGVQQVRRHLRRAREKTCSQTTAQLVAWALQRGLIDTPPRSA